MRHWWRLVNWHPAQEVEEFLFANMLNWFASIDHFIDDTFVMHGARGRNLTTTSPDVNFWGYVTGVPKPESAKVIEAALWITRHGLHSNGDALRSTFPMTNCWLPQAAGRVTDIGEFFKIREFLTMEHFIVSPLNPRWKGGFIAKSDGEFVETVKGYVNPVIKSLKTRTKLASTYHVPSPVFPP